MNRELKEMQWLITNRQFLSLRAIEAHLGMPDATLRKFLSDGSLHRKIPERFEAPLCAWIRNIAGMVEPGQKAPDKPAGKKIDRKSATPVSGEKIKRSIPPIPERRIGESGLDFAARKNEWKRKYGDTVIR